MKNIKFIGFLFVFGSLIIPYGYSQERITINDAVRIAQENNQQLRSAQLNIERDRSLKLTSFNIPQPELFIEYEGVKGSLSNAESRKIGIVQQLEFPTNYFLRSDVLSSQVLISQAELNSRLNVLRSDVKTNYYRLLLQSKLLETSRDNMTIYNDFLLVAQRKFDVGETSNLEVLNAKINRIKFENEIRNLESDMKVTQSELRNLLNINYDLIPAEDLTYTEISLSREELLQRALQNNPELQIVKFRKQKSSHLVSLSKGELLPDLSLSYYNQKLGNDNGFWGIELGVGIPLWFWAASSGNIRASNYELQILSNEEIILRKSMENQLNKSFAEYENSLRQLRFFSDEAIKETDEIFRQAKISYEQGEIGFFEYLQSLRIVYDTRIQFLNAINSYNQSIINLEQITAGEIK
ncbi:MAG: TolC family protein [Ignavibacteria bacterium]